MVLPCLNALTIGVDFQESPTPQALSISARSGTLELLEVPDDIQAKILDRLSESDNPCQEIAKLCKLDSSFAETCRTNDGFWRLACRVLGFDNPYRTTQEHALKKGPMPWRSHFKRWCKLRIKDTQQFKYVVMMSTHLTDGELTTLYHEQLGRLESWDVSMVDNFMLAFQASHITNPDLSAWNMRRAQNLSGCFVNCRQFNGNVSTWDTTNVTNMSMVFENCHEFNGDLSAWKTSKVTSFSEMFNEAWKFNQPVGSWDTSSAKDMSGMFSGCALFNQPLNDWDVSKVRFLGAMFKRCVAFNQPLDRWTPVMVRNAGNMFKDAESFDQNISGWKFHKYYDSQHDLFAGTTSIRDEFKPTIVLYDHADDGSDMDDMDEGDNWQSVIDTDSEEGLSVIDTDSEEGEESEEEGEESEESE